MTKKRLLKIGIVIELIIAAILFASSDLRCDTAKYIYDDAGRLFRVIDDQGRTATYRYDEVGNILAIERGEGGLSAPDVSGISPDSVIAGASLDIIISGNNLAGSSVSCDSPGISITAVRTSDTEISANLSISPLLPVGPVSIKAANTLGSSSAVFTIMLPPSVIDAVTPDSGPPTRLVSITGSGFSAVASENSVTFNGVTAPVYSASPGKILTAVPIGAASGPVIVKAKDGYPSNAVNFTVIDPQGPPPAISSIFPNKGPAGSSTRAVVNGSGLASVSSVLFGAGYARLNAAPGESVMDVTIPARTPGACDVTAHSEYGDAFLPGGFTYVDAPALNVVSTNPPKDVAWSVALNIRPAIAFDRAVNPSTVNSGTFALTETASGSPVDATFSFGINGAVVTCTPAASLKPNTRYSVVLTPGIESAQGVPLSSSFTNSFTTAASTDSSSLSVSVSPPDGTTGIPRNSMILFVFSKPVNLTAINDSTVTVTDNGVPVSGKLTFGGHYTTLCFTPFSSFLPSSAVKVVLSGKVTDEAGSPIIGSDGPGTDLVSNFTTATTSAMTPLRIVSVDPPDHADNVGPDASISVTFSGPLNPTTVRSNSVVLRAHYEEGDRVYAQVSLSPDHTVLTLNPERLVAGYTYHVVVLGYGLQDMAGNDLVWQPNTSFYVPWEPDFTVQGWSPGSNARGVPLNARIALAFSDAADPSSVNESTFYLKEGSDTVPGTITTSPDGLKAWLQPLQALHPDSLYSVYYTAGTKNTRGHSLHYPSNFSFYAGEETDSGPPEVINVIPSNGAEGVPVNTKAMVRFSRIMDGTTLGAGGVTLSKYGEPVSLSHYTASEDGKTLMFFEANGDPLAPNSFYNLTISASVADRAGNSLAADYQSAFTTGETADSNPPEVVSLNPPDGSTGIPVPSSIEAVFNERIDPWTISNQSFMLLEETSTYLALAHGSGAGEVFEQLHPSVTISGLAGTYQVSLDGKKVTFVPTSPLFSGRNYSIALNSIADFSGNYLLYRTYAFSTALAEGTNTDVLPTLGSIAADAQTLTPDGSASATVVVSGLVDRNGAQVPDGTRIAVSASVCWQPTWPSGSMQGGEDSTHYPGFKIFSVAGGQVSFTYQAPDLPELQAGEQAYVCVNLYSLDAGEWLTGEIQTPDVRVISLSRQ